MRVLFACTWQRNDDLPTNDKKQLTGQKEDDPKASLCSSSPKYLVVEFCCPGSVALTRTGLPLPTTSFYYFYDCLEFVCSKYQLQRDTVPSRVMFHAFCICILVARTVGRCPDATDACSPYSDASAVLSAYLSVCGRARLDLDLAFYWPAKVCRDLEAASSVATATGSIGQRQMSPVGTFSVRFLATLCLSVICLLARARRNQEICAP